MEDSLMSYKEVVISNELNISIFKFFNEIFGKPIFNDAILIGAKLGSTGFLSYYLLLFTAFASFLIYQKKHDKLIAKELAISWLSAAITLFISLGFCFIIITLIKNYASVPRPYCNLENIYVFQSIVAKLSCNMSFPSGHTAFSTIIVASFWPLFNRLFKIISVILVIFIAISRMAAGAHYPMDLFGAIATCLPLTLYIRYRISLFIHHQKNNNFPIITNLVKLLTSLLSKFML